MLPLVCDWLHVLLVASFVSVITDEPSPTARFRQVSLVPAGLRGVALPKYVVGPLRVIAPLHVQCCVLASSSREGVGVNVTWSGHALCLGEWAL